MNTDEIIELQALCLVFAGLRVMDYEDHTRVRPKGLALYSVRNALMRKLLGFSLVLPPVSADEASVGLCYHYTGDQDSGWYHVMSHHAAYTRIDEIVNNELSPKMLKPPWPEDQMRKHDVLEWLNTLARAFKVGLLGTVLKPLEERPQFLPVGDDIAIYGGSIFMKPGSSMTTLTASGSGTTIHLVNRFTAGTVIPYPMPRRPPGMSGVFVDYEAPIFRYDDMHDPKPMLSRLVTKPSDTWTATVNKLHSGVQLKGFPKWMRDKGLKELLVESSGTMSGELLAEEINIALAKRDPALGSASATANDDYTENEDDVTATIDSEIQRSLKTTLKTPTALAELGARAGAVYAQINQARGVAVKTSNAAFAMRTQLQIAQTNFQHVPNPWYGTKSFAACLEILGSSIYPTVTLQGGSISSKIAADAAVGAWFNQVLRTPESSMADANALASLINLASCTAVALSSDVGSLVSIADITTANLPSYVDRSQKSKAVVLAIQILTGQAALKCGLTSWDGSSPPIWFMPGGLSYKPEATMRLVSEINRNSTLVKFRGDHVPTDDTEADYISLRFNMSQTMSEVFETPPTSKPSWLKVTHNVYYLKPKS